MGEEGRRMVGRTEVAPRCPVCGSPLVTRVKRRKTLGLVVPRWTPVRCENPDCPTVASGTAPDTQAGGGGRSEGRGAEAGGAGRGTDARHA
jgi:hypothetical protein